MMSCFSTRRSDGVARDVTLLLSRGGQRWSQKKVTGPLLPSVTLASGCYLGRLESNRGPKGNSKVTGPLLPFSGVHTPKLGQGNKVTRIHGSLGSVRP